MHLSRSDPAETEAARRRLELLARGLEGDGDTGVSGPATPAPTEPPQAMRPGRHAARDATPGGRVSARVLDALPPTLRGRWGITAHHVTVVALLVASAMVLAAWWLLRAQPQPVDAVPVTATRQEAAPNASTRASAPEEHEPADAGGGNPDRSAAADLVVHVAGKVKHPGIVTLPAGSRVIDALQEAGGPRRGVDLSTLNLARALADGEQLLVGVPGTASGRAGQAPSPADSSGGSGAGPGGPVNLNTATSAQLEELPGVGPVTAASILEWRDEHGHFSSVEELLEVSGIGEATLADLRDLVTV
jgi:competence protein ComEA